MKDKPFAVVITLLAGAIACILCIYRHVGLLSTLVTVFIVLLVFMIVGSIANKFMKSVHDEVIQHEKDEEERIKKEREEEEEREFLEHQRRLAEEAGAEKNADSDSENEEGLQE